MATAISTPPKPSLEERPLVLINGNPGPVPSGSLSRLASLMPKVVRLGKGVGAHDT